MSWLYGISMIGFVSTDVRALLAALQYAVVGVPEPDDDELPEVTDAVSLLVLCLLITGLLVIRVPIAFAFFGPSLAYMLTTDQSRGAGAATGGQADRQLPACSPCRSSSCWAAWRTMPASPTGSSTSHSPLLGRVRGSLGYVSVGVSVGFSWMSGSAVADAAALGKLQIPAMLRNGYSKKFALGVTGSASLIAPVMPPSIPAVIYAGLAAVSTGALFAASVVPALLMAVGLCIVVFILVRRDDNIQRTEFSWPRVWETGRRVIAPMGAPVVILGGILGGYFTPTEAAAVGAAYMAVLGLRATGPCASGTFPKVLTEAVLTTGAHHADRRLGEPARLHLRPGAGAPGDLRVDARV